LLVSLSSGVLQFLDQSKRLLVHGRMVAHHVLRELLHLLVACLFEGLLRGLDIDLARRVSDVRDLRISQFCSLRHRNAAGEADNGNSRA